MTFLNTLRPEQREKVQFPFTRQPTATAAHFKGGLHGDMTFVGEQYDQAMWSDLPVGDVPRPGLRLGSLSAPQRDAVMQMLQVLLSAKGYQKVLDIMGSDQALGEDTHFAAGPEYYVLGIFGAPSPTTPWMVQFGGHQWQSRIDMPPFSNDARRPARSTRCQARHVKQVSGNDFSDGWFINWKEKTYVQN